MRQASRLHLLVTRETAVSLTNTRNITGRRKGSRGELELARGLVHLCMQLPRKQSNPGPASPAFVSLNHFGLFAGLSPTGIHTPRGK